MNRNIQERRAVREQIVDSDRLVSFEIIRRRNNALVPFDSKQFVAQRIEQICIDHIFENRVALVLDFMERLGECAFTGRRLLHLSKRIIPGRTRIFVIRTDILYNDAGLSTLCEIHSTTRSKPSEHAIDAGPSRLRGARSQ